MPETTDDWTHVPSRRDRRRPNPPQSPTSLANPQNPPRTPRRRRSLRSDSPPPPLPLGLNRQVLRTCYKIRNIPTLEEAVKRLADICVAGEGVEELLVLGLGRLGMEVAVWQVAVVVEVLRRAGGEKGWRGKVRMFDPVWVEEERAWVKEIGKFTIAAGADEQDSDGEDEKTEVKAEEQAGAEVGFTVDVTPGDWVPKVAPCEAVPEPKVSEQKTEVGKPPRTLLIAPHLELEILREVLSSYDSALLGAFCNDLSMAGCSDSVARHGWMAREVEEVKEAAQGRAFNHLVVYWNEGVGAVRDDERERGRGAGNEEEGQRRVPLQLRIGEEMEEEELRRALEESLKFNGGGDEDEAMERALWESLKTSEEERKKRGGEGEAL